jgi:hypothetical protein
VALEVNVGNYKDGYKEAGKAYHVRVKRHPDTETKDIILSLVLIFMHAHSMHAGNEVGTMVIRQSSPVFMPSPHFHTKIDIAGSFQRWVERLFPPVDTLGQGQPHLPKRLLHPILRLPSLCHPHIVHREQLSR